MFSWREVIAQRSGEPLGQVNIARGQSVERQSPGSPTVGVNGSGVFVSGGVGMNYKSKRWKTLRAGILRRDGYQCRECRRYGKVVQAETAHHVYPVAFYSQWTWDTWNLVALCSGCHRAMHNPDGSLTDKGLAWCRRVSPPPGSACPGPMGTGEGKAFRRTGKRGGG